MEQLSQQPELSFLDSAFGSIDQFKHATKLFKGRESRPARHTDAGEEGLGVAPKEDLEHENKKLKGSRPKRKEKLLIRYSTGLDPGGGKCLPSPNVTISILNAHPPQPTTQNSQRAGSFDLFLEATWETGRALASRPARNEQAPWNTLDALVARPETMTRSWSVPDKLRRHAPCPCYERAMRVYRADFWWFFFLLSFILGQNATTTYSKYGT